MRRLKNDGNVKMILWYSWCIECTCRRAKERYGLETIGRMEDGKDVDDKGWDDCEMTEMIITMTTSKITCRVQLWRGIR